MKNTLEYVSDESESTPKLSFVQIVAFTFMTLSLEVGAFYTYAWYESVKQKGHGENYGDLFLLFGKPIAKVLNILFLFGFVVCMIALEKLTWLRILGLAIIVGSTLVVWVFPLST